ncbi:MAG: hypothetical protein ACK5MJ_04555 [Alphaproteobacteria bacterium]
MNTVKTLKKLSIALMALTVVSACTQSNPNLAKAASQAQKGKCQTEQLGPLLSLDAKSIGKNIPKNIRVTGSSSGTRKVKGQHKNVPKKGRITLGVNSKGEVISAYCG